MTHAQALGRAFGRRMRILRQIRGLTAREVAVLAGAPYEQLLTRERGTRGITVGDALMWCDALAADINIIMNPAYSDVQAAELAYKHPR